MGKLISGIAWEPHQQAGQTYDLTHLHPKLLEITIPASGKNAERNLRIAVSYSLHCFARSELPDELVPADSWCSDSRERRVFDVDRWHLSTRLPAIIASLEKRRCLHTGREEFVTIEIIENGRKFDYAVFFTVSRAGKGKGADLNLYVNSAHERTDKLVYTKPISFHFILLNRYLGRDIKPPP